MQPPTKDQADLGVDSPSLDASEGALLTYDNVIEIRNEDRARQEFAAEADINTMLSKFGVTAPRSAPVYGETDDTLDLQQALEAVREARAGFNNLPAELRTKFGSMEEFLRAVDNGSLVLKNEPLPEPGSGGTIPPPK